MSVDAPRITFEEGLAKRELRYQTCCDCSSTIFYPRVLCPKCGSTNLEWKASSGQGTVYSTTRVIQRDEDDYNVCLVDLDDGFRMMSTVIGGSTDVEIGTAVTVDFAKLNSHVETIFRRVGMPDD